VGGRGWSPFSGSAVANSDFLKAALKLYPKKVASRPSGRQRFPRRKGNLKFYLPSSFPLLLKSPSNFPSYKKDEFASSSRLIPMLPLPAPAKLPLHDSESFSETPQGEPGSIFQLPQIPVVHSKKCPNYSSPPQYVTKFFLNVSSMNYEFTGVFSKFQGKTAIICLFLKKYQIILRVGAF
jgi:hypothetical protein